MRAAAPLFLLAGLGGCAETPAGAPRFIASAALGADYGVPVDSMQDRRFAGVIRQRYDFSCGSAALATLLRHHYDFAVGEDTAFRGMWAAGDRDAIRKVGFSLLDMKRWLATRGLPADGYKVPLAKVASTGIPGIALISVKNYKHFVVVKGVRGGEVLLGDPSAGLTIMPRAEFEAAWNGIFFVLSADQPLAKRRFNTDTQWASLARAPLGDRFADPVSLQALSLTAPFYRDF